MGVFSLSLSGISPDVVISVELLVQVQGFAVSLDPFAIENSYHQLEAWLVKGSHSQMTAAADHTLSR